MSERDQLSFVKNELERRRPPLRCSAIAEALCAIAIVIVFTSWWSDSVDSVAPAWFETDAEPGLSWLGEEGDYE